MTPSSLPPWPLSSVERGARCPRSHRGPSRWRRGEGASFKSSELTAERGRILLGRRQGGQGGGQEVGWMGRRRGGLDERRRCWWRHGEEDQCKRPCQSSTLCGGRGLGMTQWSGRAGTGLTTIGLCCALGQAESPCYGSGHRTVTFWPTIAGSEVFEEAGLQRMRAT